jgi:small subunit ribosomal protein S5
MRKQIRQLKNGEEEEEKKEELDDFYKSLPVSSGYFHHAILMRRSVVQQTPKGKIRRISYMVLMGDGNGLVGYGQGKHSNGRTALRAAQLSAIKNMD